MVYRFNFLAKQSLPIFENFFKCSYPEQRKEIASKDAAIAEKTEKIRFLHSQIKNAKDHTKALEERNLRNIDRIEQGFEREREEFKRKKAELENLYKVILAGKDKSLTDQGWELKGKVSVLFRVSFPTRNRYNRRK